MDFSLSDEQKALRDSVLKLPPEQFGATLEDDDLAGRFPWAGWKRCAALGLLGLPLPQEHGGSGAGLLTTLLVIEALGYRCKDAGLVHAMVSHILCGMQIAAYGSEEQKRRYLPPIAAGEVVGAQALTEPDAGSDVPAIKTRAERVDGEYVLSGTKTFISNGPSADVAIVYASTGKGAALGSLSCIIVEKDTPGFERCKPLQKMGLRTLQNGELTFDNCRVPVSNLLGHEGQGMMAFGRVMEWERCLLFGSHLGTMRRVLEESVRYAKERRQFGSPIGRFQAVSHRISNIAVNLELGRLILYKAAWLNDQGKRVPFETAVGKLFVSESVREACLDAVQIHGGYGYMTEFGLERDLRDSIASTIYSGTSEIQRNLIAALLGL
jgi:alkylation response protein AidB-like acyl-CoA dehydrogenase